jgi:hypothetical protein
MDFTPITQITPITPKIYICKGCDFICYKNSDYIRHNNTAKHERLTRRLTGLITKTAQENTEVVKKCVCYCGKEYKHMSSLCKHKRNCNISNPNKIIKKTKPIKTDENIINTIMEVVKQNNEFKELLIEQNKQIIELSSKSTTTNNNTTNNTTNNNFNLNFFLNETCKDALNITDFVNQLQVGINELEETGRLGYAAGISKIFINGLKQLDINQRPVHCSDLKRETIYIKDENLWAKEDVENPKLTNAIRDVANKNIQQISVWTDKHPEYMNSSSRCSDRYMKIVVEAMSGSTPEESDKNYKKIARNITKESVINK